MESESEQVKPVIAQHSFQTSLMKLHDNFFSKNT